MIDEKPLNSVKVLKRKNKRELSKTEVYAFFACLVVVDPRGWPCFHFIGMFTMGLGIGRAKGLAIGGAILMGADIAISFFRLSLW